MDLFTCLDPKFWSKARLETFTNWPFNHKVPCNPKAMAAAGFFAVNGTEEPDLAQCFFCGKQLDGWEATDDPWQEHKSHQVNCPYIKLDKTVEQEWTLEETFSLLQEYYRSLCHQKVKSLKENIQRETQKLAAEIPKLLQKSKKNKKSMK